MKANIIIWERFAFWDSDAVHEYRWWPVVNSAWVNWSKMLRFEFQFLRWRVGISFIITKR